MTSCKIQLAITHILLPWFHDLVVVPSFVILSYSKVCVFRFTTCYYRVLCRIRTNFTLFMLFLFWLLLSSSFLLGGGNRVSGLLFCQTWKLREGPYLEIKGGAKPGNRKTRGGVQQIYSVRGWQMLAAGAKPYDVCPFAQVLHSVPSGDLQHPGHCLLWLQ